MEENLHALKQLILEKTEGTPFFMEEIVQELKEQGVLTVGTHGRAPLPTDLHLPPTVQGVLAARIDRLAPDEKVLLQQLAVIGREFPLSLVRPVIAQPEDELYRILSALQRKEFLYEQPAFPEPEYVFKHALTQEVAYNSVLIERRKTLHEQTAQAIEQLYHDRIEEHYSELAHHYSRSGNAEKAVKYLHLAGQQAVQRSAYVEAITHLTVALELLKTLPDTPERAQQELVLQIALGVTLTVTKGYASPEVGLIYARALELCRQVGGTSQLFPTLWGLSRFYRIRAELRISRELGEQLLDFAEHQQDPAARLQAHRTLGASLLWLGELDSSRAHLEQGLALANLQQRSLFTFSYAGEDPGVSCRSFVAFTLWCLGYPNQALKRNSEAIALARELAHPFSLAFALGFAAMLHYGRRDQPATQEHAEAVITLSTDQGMPVWLASGTVYQGWILAEQGQTEEGVARIRQGLAAMRAAGTEGTRSYALALLAEVYSKMSQAEEGLSVLAEALAFVAKTEERFWEAELYRLKGELTLQLKVESHKSQVPSTQHPAPSTQAQGEAEACFLKALDIARQQQAKSLELRAVMSLVRLRQQQALEQGAGSAEQGAGSAEQGARTTDHAIRNTQHVTRTALDEARTMLSEIYGWFTEGFDTKDLQEAKALLDSLASGV
jgi:predicted ATPase